MPISLATPTVATMLLCVLVLFAGALSCVDVVATKEPAAAAAQPARAEEAPPSASFAVVELFTSEGCSSCPPADRVLAELAADARRDARPVFALAFHVDYWDRLGWNDRFADPAHAQRQREYAKWLKSDLLYTPQMIVNGTASFVGSDGARARREIDAALRLLARASVALTIGAPANPGECVVEYVVRSADGVDDTLLAGAILNVAWVERNLSSKVLRGENGGQFLRHENVVRSFRAVPLGRGRSGRVMLPIPEDIDRASSSVIGYVQEGRGFAVVAAARVDPAAAAATQPK